MPPKKNKKAAAAAESPRSAEPETPRDDAEAEEEEEEQTGNKREGGDISKVTDYVEQKELDSTKASQAITSITQEIKIDREAELARERELAAVSIEQARRTSDSCPSTRMPRARVPPAPQCAQFGRSHCSRTLI